MFEQIASEGGIKFRGSIDPVAVRLFAELNC
jgi:hypothetical protein